jgi:IPT/TIG domain
MYASMLAAGNQNAPAVSAGSKAGAILIGVAFLVVLYVVTAFITGHWRLKEVFNGFDGFGSTSKLQWFLWLIAILFGYVATWVLRAEQGDYAALSDIPVNLLTVLGFSTGTAAAAKGITAGYVQTGKVAKTGVPANPTPATTGGVFQDDSGGPELAKIQMIAFTIIAIGIFLATVFHQIAIGDIKDGLPNIDSSLLVLMGISQGGYLGKKLVTFGTPALFAPNPLSGPPGTPVTVTGSGLGAQQGNSQLLLNGAPIAATPWSDTSIQFTVPADDPATGVAWASLPKAVPLVVSMTGQLSNSATFKVT